MGKKREPTKEQLEALVKGRDAWNKKRKRKNAKKKKKTYYTAKD